MKRISLLIIGFFCVLLMKSQTNFNESIINRSKLNKAYLNFLPSNANPEDLRPADIPSKAVLKSMGLSEKEITEALDYKLSKGKYNLSNEDTLFKGMSAEEKFYLSFGNDSLFVDTTKYPKARIYGQDIFRNNNLDFFQKAHDAKAPENYKVGSGDEISISVWGYSEFSENLLVDEKGYINPSSYGRIYVKGLTFKKMRSLIKSKFSSLFDMNNSEIDVTLSYSRVITVNIVGEVYNPGSYSIPAINTAFNALIAAKGPNQIGSVRNIYLKRNGQTIDSLDIYSFLFNPVRSQDIYMQDGDYLFVPPAKNIVEINGEVNSPYTYESKQGENVFDLIKYAGGITKRGFSDLVTIKRIDYNSLKVLDVHNKDFKTTYVKNGDEIIINSINNKLSNVITLKGNIGVIGDYEFIEGEKLLDLLNRAKCIDEKTYLEKVFVISLNKDRTRTHKSINLHEILNNPSSENNILLNEFDIVRVLSKDDFIDDQFSVEIYGAVRSPGKLDYGAGMTLQDALLQSGGIIQESEGSRIEISRVMDYDISSNSLSPIRAVAKIIPIKDRKTLNSESESIFLQPNDQIFVRKNPDFKDQINVTLLGEVRYPGTYALTKKNEQIISLVNRAGGLTEESFPDGTKMFRKFSKKIGDIEEKINMPSILLDSMMTDLQLQSIYNSELLRIEKAKKTKLISDTTFYEVVSFDMQQALSNPKSKHNLVLQDGDKIVIPKRLDVVHVTGNLNNIEGNSISSPYFSGKRANFYINNFAGGYTNENKKSNTIVIYPNGATKKSINFGLFSLSPKVKPGSTIKVINTDTKLKYKKKEDIDYNKHIESVIIKISGIMSLYLLIERLNNSF